MFSFIQLIFIYLQKYLYQIFHQLDEVLLLPSLIINPVVSHSDSISIYSKQQLKKFELSDNSDGIPTIFYNETDYAVIDYNHEITKLFKTRILLEYSPFGNIIMYFDPVKLSFAYYSDQYVSSYTVLNAVAMKYCGMYRTCHFFVDENIRKSPLLDILKNYYYADNVLPVLNTEPTEIDPDYEFIKQNSKLFLKSGSVKTTPVKVEKYRNKFVYLGRIRDFNPLQNVKKNLSHSLLFPQDSEIEKDMFNWKSYKTKRNKL